MAILLFLFGVFTLPGKETALLTQLEFSPRLDLAKNQAPKLVREPTTGVTIRTDTGSADAPYSLERAKDGSLHWKMASEVGTLSKMFFTAKLPAADYAAMPYFRIRMRAKGLLRSIGKYNVLTIGKDTILEAGDFYNDGREHSVIGKFTKLPNAGDAIQLELATDGSGVELSILEFTLFHQLPADETIFAQASDKAWKGFQKVDISSQFNANLAEVAENTVKKFHRIHDYPAIAADTVSVKGVPFAVKQTGKNLIMPPFTPDTLKKKGVFYDTPVGNNYFRPTRLDEIVIPLSGKTAELYAILGGELFPVHAEYVSPAIPFRIADVDCFGVQVDYADGTHDRSVPRHIAADGFGIQGTASAYAIAVDRTKELKAVRFQNRYSNLQMGVMALSRNAGAPLVISEALRNPAPQKINAGKTVAEKNLSVKQAADQVTLANGHYEAVFRAGEEFALLSIRNLHAPDVPIALANSGFELRVDKTLYTGKNFRAENVTILPDGVRFRLQSKIAELPLAVTLTVTGGKGDELLFRSELENLGNAPVRALATMPALNGLAIGSLKDTFVYFPKHRVVNRATSGSWFTPVHERAFHVQFMDFYNPEAGAGIAIHTRDRAGELFDFLAIKNDAGIRTGIHYPRDWSMLAPKAKRHLVDVVLEFHGGDWHQALEAYQKWVASWFKLYPTELPEAWTKMFYLRGENNFRKYNWQIAMLDPKTNEFRIDAFRKTVSEYMDCDNSLWHLAMWNVPEGKKTDNSGNYDDGIYDLKNIYPSADRLKALIEDCHKHGELISLYTIATYLPIDSPIGSTKGEELAQINGVGGPVKGPSVYFPCLHLWMDTYAKALQKAQAELNVDAIYLDCYPFGRYSNTCYSTKHGHPYPMQLNQTQHQLLVKIREALPKHVAIWTEGPSIDYDAAYLNGNITYYCTTIHEHRAKSYDVNDAENRDFYEPLQNIQRYTMPHLKQMCFVCGWIPSGPRMNEINGIFFNGEGVNDAAFCLFDDHSRAKVQHWLHIEKALTDCFTSKKITPMVPTAAGEIYANRFEGDGRTVWTLWNARFNTYRGSVLELPYKEGVKYFDVWNARPIQAKRQGDKVILAVSEMEPQGLGCLLEYTGELPAGLPTTTVDEREKHLITHP